MKRDLGPTPTIFFIGIVEDRNDPEELGRVRVRVFGLHTESKVDIPTKDLPWSPVIMSSTNPGKSGVGWSPNGLVPGSKVIGYFSDGAAQQQYVVLGSHLGINDDVYGGPQSAIPAADAKSPAVVNAANPATSTNRVDANGNPLPDGVAQDPNTVPRENAPEVVTVIIPPWKLGQSSISYETERRSPGDITIVDGVAFYGKWMFSSQTEDLKSYVKVCPYTVEFGGLDVPGTQFNYIWGNLGKTNTTEFADDQYDYVKKTVYQKLIAKLAHVQMSERGNGVQDCIWATSVLYGVTGGLKVVNRALADKDLTEITDVDIVTLIQDDKVRNIAEDFKGKSTDGLAARFAAEKSAMLLLCEDVATPDLPPTPVPATDIYKQPIIKPLPANTRKEPTEDKEPAGFKDPKGVYPKKLYKGAADTNHQARNKSSITGTATDAKSKSILSNAGEPASPYKAKYPYNKVYESESGHVIEIDDTIGGERVHVYHRSGSYIEFYPDGTIVKKSVKDDTEIVLSNKSVYVVGTCNITVEGNTAVKCMGSIDIQAKDDISMMAGGNISIMAGGDLVASSARNSNFQAGKQASMDAPKIVQNAGAAGAVKIDIGSKIEAQMAMAEQTDAGPDDSPDDEPDISAEQAKADFEKKNGYKLPTDPANTATFKDEPIVEKVMTVSISNSNPHTVTIDADSVLKSTDGLVVGQTLSGTGIPKGASIASVIDTSTFTIDKDVTNSVVSSIASFGPPVAKHVVVEVAPTSGPYTPAYQLSENVTIKDMTATPVSPFKLVAQVGLTEDQIVQNMKAVAVNVIEPVHKLMGAGKYAITNALRNAVGAKYPSDHHFGSAVDFQFPGIAATEIIHIAKKISDILPAYHQVILEYHANAPVVHIAYRLPGHPRGDNKKTTHTAFKTPFTGMPRGFCDKNMNLIYP